MCLITQQKKEEKYEGGKQRIFIIKANECQLCMEHLAVKKVFEWCLQENCNLKFQNLKIFGATALQKCK